MRKFSIILVLVIVGAMSCVEKLDLSGVAAEPHLVVEGMITNEPGPYTVELYMSSGLNENLDRPNYVGGATVMIKNDLGEEELLMEESTGIYRTNATGMQGVIGRKYQLFITLPNGKSFQSPMDEMKSPGEIDHLYFEFKRNSINGNDISKPQDAFWIYLNSSNEAAQEATLLRWRWTGTYKVKTFPELHTKFIGLVEVPDPYPCSGYIVTEEGELTQVGDCTCCECWLTEHGSNALISKNEFLEDENFRRVPITRIPVIPKIFDDKYYVQAEQLRVSESCYNFWKLVEAYQSSAENVFQPNAVKVKGNITSKDDADEEVFGVFTVAGITRKGVFFDRTDIPYPLALNDTITMPCQTAYPGGTNKKPIFW